MADGSQPERTLSDILSDGEGSLRARFTSPEVTQYLSNLTSLRLPDILQEPSNLASEAAQLTNSLTSLCYSEYPTFLSLHRTSSVLSSTLSSFSSSLSSLIGAIPALETQARSFSEVTTDIQAARRKARLVLQQHDTLVDVLDIPQLIDTCVRNAYYQEAMDLSSHAIALATRFPGVAVVQDVAAESAQAMRMMLGQLLGILREPAKLPALFKAVSFLRKMGALEELELALTFLTSRLSNLNSTIEGIEKDHVDHARYVRRYVDVWREGVYDVVTQFTTIFLDRAPSEELAVELRYLLATLTHHAIKDLLEVLSSNLSKVEDATSLSSLLTQLTHCSSSFARVGLDFRSLLPPVFEDAVKTRFSQGLDAATGKFLNTISDAQKYERQPSQVLITTEAASSPPEDTTLSGSLRIPPSIVSSYPPLAVYLNAIIATLNTLRLLAPASLSKELLSALDLYLAKASSSFLVYCQVSIDIPSRKRTLSLDEDAPDQARVLKASGKVFVKVVVPYSRRALTEGIYDVHDNLDMDDSLKNSLTEWDGWLNTSLETS